MYATLNWIEVRQTDLQDYFDVRSRSIDPALRSWDGFGEPILLKGREAPVDGIVRLALVNTWRDAEAQRSWNDSKLVIDAKRPAAPFVQRIDWKLYERVDDASFTLSPTPASRMGAFGFHQVLPGRAEEYLARRRDIINPSMAAAQGCVAVWVYRDPDLADRFVVFFQWESDQAADAYFDTPEHRGPVVNAVRSITEGNIVSTRYDVVTLITEGVASSFR